MLENKAIKKTRGQFCENIGTCFICRRTGFIRWADKASPPADEASPPADEASLQADEASPPTDEASPNRTPIGP